MNHTVEDEWFEASLAEVALPDAPIGYGIVQPGPYIRGGIPVLAIRDIFDPSIRTAHRSSQQVEAPYRRSRVRGGDILISVKGTTGRVGIVPEGFEGNISRDVARLRLREEHDPRYWLHLLRSDEAQQTLQGAAVGTTRQELSIGILKALRFRFPGKAIQERVAAALEDADDEVAAIADLITKKQAVKQGMMQQLLTGKTRLPGFSGEWGWTRLGEHFDVTSSKRVFQREWRSSGVPFYRARELAVLGESGSVNNELFIDRELYEKYKRQHGAPRPNDFLVTAVGTLGKMYVVQKGDEFYFKDGNIIWLKASSSYDSLFLKYLFETPLVQDQIHGESSGTTVGTYTIVNAKRTVVPLASLAEQRAIADVLGSIDAELLTLLKRRAKAGLIKQGMMQQLLTGRTRLPVQETAA